MDGVWSSFAERHPKLPLLGKCMEKAVTALLLDIWNLECHDPEVILYKEGDVYHAQVIDKNAEKEVIFPAEGEGSVDRLAAIEALQSRLESELRRRQEERS